MPLYAGYFEPAYRSRYTEPVTMNVMAENMYSAHLMLYSFGLEMAPDHRLTFVWEDNDDDYYPESAN